MTASAEPPDRIATTAAGLGTALLAPAAIAPAVAVALLAAGAPVGAAPFLVGLAAGIAIAARTLRAGGGRSAARAVAEGSLVVAGGWATAAALSLALLDSSWDGQWYHASAILDLCRGWNPILDGSDSFRAEATRVWIDHYPKGAWLLAASLHRLGVPFEATKAASWVLLASAFLLALAAIRVHSREHRALGVAVAAAAALNPIVFAQLFTFYVDGQLACALTALCAALLLAGEPRLRRIGFVAAALAAVYAVNLKFTGIAYVGVAILAFGAIAWRARLAGARRAFLALSAAAAIGVAGVGFQPYVTNALDHGHPFHPLMGAGSVDLVGATTPAGLREHGRVGALLVSTFSETSRQDVRPKLPFGVRLAELDAMRVSDARIGGFGPLFGGAVLLAAATALAILLRGGWRDPGWLLVGAVVASVLVNPAAWWARYVPQLWLVPVAVGLLALRAGRPLAARVAVLLAIAGGLSTAFVQVQTQVKKTRAFRRHLDQVALLAAPVRVHFGPFEGLEVRLAERGIAYEKLDSPPDCPAPLRAVYEQYQVCPAQDAR